MKSNLTISNFIRSLWYFTHTPILFEETHKHFEVLAFLFRSILSTLPYYIELNSILNDIMRYNMILILLCP